MSDRKTMILTGASRGIGHATVKRFSREGWRIITCSREEVPEECGRDPNWTHHISADLADPASREHFADAAEAALDGGPLAALINNAAISPGATALTRTPRPANSTAISRVSAESAAFDTL